MHKSPAEVFIIKLVDSGKTSFNITNLGVHVKHGGSVNINSSVLYASDKSNKIEDIMFKIIKHPVYGRLIFHNNESFSVLNFTIFDLSNNLISYKHNEFAKVTSDSFDLIATNGVIHKNITFNITIIGIVNKVPTLEVILPLHVNPFDAKTFVITSQHLFSYQPFLTDDKINYIITEPTKYGSITFDGKKSNLNIFSQEDIDKGLITYVPLQNASFSDEFYFQVTNNIEEGYLFNGVHMLKPIMYALKFVSKTVIRSLIFKYMLYLSFIVILSTVCPI